MPINTNPMTPDEVYHAIMMLSMDSDAYKLSTMLWGAPGVGKTHTVEALALARAREMLPAFLEKLTDSQLIARAKVILGTKAKDMGDADLLAFAKDEPNAPDAVIKARYFRDVRLTSMEPVDLRGLPYLKHDTQQSVFYTPTFLPQFEGPGVIFVDELTAADRRLQAASYGLMLERRIGEYGVPDGWIIIAAGNGEEHGAISNPMGTALMDRMIHYSIRPDSDAWIKWALRTNIHPAVTTFIKVNPHRLEMCEERIKNADQAIAPSPRGWERVSKVLYAFEKSGAPKVALQRTVAGIIGNNIAAEFFLVYEEVSAVNDIEKLMNAKTDEEITRLLPKKVNSLHCITYAMIGMVNKDSLNQIMKIMYMIRKLKDSSIPAEELSVAGMEMIFGKAGELKLFKEVLASPVYKEYRKSRQEQGLD